MATEYLGKRRLAAVLVVLLYVVVCAPAAASAEEPAGNAAKLNVGMDALRLLEAEEAETAKLPPSPRDSFLAPTPRATVSEETFRRAAQAGQESVTGVQVRDGLVTGPENSPYFEGTWKRIHHSYMGQDIYTYDHGVYAVPQVAAYVGNFHYFPQPMADWEIAPKGAIVMVGKKILPDGSSETGLFIDEHGVSGFGFTFVKATPEYLDRFQQRHAASVEAYRQRKIEEARQRQIEEAESDFDFGQIFALGLGAAMIGMSDLPGADKIEVGGAFVADVIGDTGGTNMYNAMISKIPSNPDSLYGGGADYAAPGLNEILDGGAPAGGIADGGSASGGVTGGSVAGAGGQQTARSEDYSFTCPSGQTYSIPVSYKNPSCGAAMKNLAKTYSCNLIGDMQSAQSQCQSACGHPTCAEQ